MINKTRGVYQAEPPIDLISNLVPSPVVTFGFLEICTAIAIVIYAGKSVYEALSESEDSDHK